VSACVCMCVRVCVRMKIDVGPSVRVCVCVYQVQQRGPMSPRGVGQWWSGVPARAARRGHCCRRTLPQPQLQAIRARTSVSE
jgi:hypothetical protein